MFENEYFIAFYGWVIFNAILLGLSKDEDDAKKKRFNVKIWWRYHWDNVGITLLCIPLTVEFTEDLWLLIVSDLFSKDWDYTRLSLLGSVPLTQFIYAVIKKLTKKS